MNTLAQRTCQPCAKGTPPLAKEQIQLLLPDLQDWEVVDGKVLRKTLKLKDFQSVVKLVYKIAEVAEAQDHHPDLHLTNYRQLTIELSTHSIGGLSENDFILAAKIDSLL